MISLTMTNRPVPRVASASGQLIPSVAITMFAGPLAEAIRKCDDRGGDVYEEMSEHAFAEDRELTPSRISSTSCVV